MENATIRERTAMTAMLALSMPVTAGANVCIYGGTAMTGIPAQSMSVIFIGGALIHLWSVELERGV
jgi:hypothetical protein